MTEREEFDDTVAKYTECEAPVCACMGGCLGNLLAIVRKKYDGDYEGEEHWWSDQLHGALKKREGDSGRVGAALNADNYWKGVK